MNCLQSQQTYTRCIHYRPKIDALNSNQSSMYVNTNNLICIVPDLNTKVSCDEQHITIDNGLYTVSDLNNALIGTFSSLNNAKYAFILYTEYKVSNPMLFIEQRYGKIQSDTVFA